MESHWLWWMMWRLPSGSQAQLGSRRSSCTHVKIAAVRPSLRCSPGHLLLESPQYPAKSSHQECTTANCSHRPGQLSGSIPIAYEPVDRLPQLEAKTQLCSCSPGACSSEMARWIAR